MSRRIMPIDEQLWRLSQIIRTANLPDWERNFIKSILVQSKRQAWEPSSKQLRLMRTIIAKAAQPPTALIEETGG